MASLFCMPIELLIHIFSYLDLPSLYHVSLTSKQFNIVSRCLLWESCCERIINQTVSYRAFLRSILENPNLPHHVKKIRAYYGTSEPRGFQMPDEADLTLFQDAIDTLDIPETSKRGLKDSVQHDHGDPLVAMLLCILPNLQKLIVQCPHRSDWTEDIIEHAACGDLDVLKSLHTVIIHHNYGDQFEPLQSGLFRVLGVPSVKTFIVTTAYAVCNLETILPPKSSSVEHIFLILCDMLTAGLHPIIGSSNALKTFVFVRSDPGTRELQFSPCDTVQTLHQHRSTLEELTIYLNRGWELVNWGIPQEDIYIGTGLRDFEQLRILRCDMVCLLGFDYLADWADVAYYAGEPSAVGAVSAVPEEQSRNWPALVDALPRSIETLVIFDATESIMRHLEDIRDVKAERFPCLRELVVFFNHVGIPSQLNGKRCRELEIDGVEVTLDCPPNVSRPAEQNYVYTTFGDFAEQY